MIRGLNSAQTKLQCRLLGHSDFYRDRRRPCRNEVNYAGSAVPIGWNGFCKSLGDRPMPRVAFKAVYREALLDFRPPIPQPFQFFPLLFRHLCAWVLALDSFNPL